MEKITNIYLINTRYPSGGRGEGLGKGWFYLPCVGFSKGFSTKKSSSTKNTYSFYLKETPKRFVRGLEQKDKTKKAFYARIHKLHREFLITTSYTCTPVSKTLPSNNIPSKKRFVVRYENLEQWVLFFFLNKVRGLVTTDYWKISNVWGNDVPLLKKSGIYLLHNKITKKNYVGKSSNLLARLENYCDFPFLERNQDSSSIYRALIKFGHQNFSFSILEHCDENDLNIREQQFINLIKPQYNIRKTVFKTKNRP